jgi:hypothetical protein
MTEARASGLLRSPACQTVGVVGAVLVIAILNRQSDGLWFQGDAPRHAANGLFWWDLLTAWPRDPVDYAVSYYARYPVIAPASYPPLFYILEGLAFAVFGPSPYVARCLVLLCAGVAGVYTMAWGRTWIDPLAGWCGAFLAFTPGMALWSNAVMLNVPATAAALASLYHFRRWLETSVGQQLALSAAFVTAALLTYYPSASILPILAMWALLRLQRFRPDRKSVWFVAAAVIATVPLLTALWLTPVHTARQLPTFALLSAPGTWTYYWRALPDVIGGVALALGLAGCAAGYAVVRWRTETTFVVIWIVVLIAGLSLLPAKDSRYVLLAAPAFVLLGAIGVLSAVRWMPIVSSWSQAAILTAGFGVALWSASRVQVPEVAGFRELATYLRDTAPREAVLYDGDYDGIFGFYVRALDPGFERRVALANKLLYQYGPTTTFTPVQSSKAATADEMSSLVRNRSGCRWIAIEVSRRTGLPRGQRLLREAVRGSAFELVRSFPITGAGERRVDLYRVLGEVAAVESLDLTFPSFSARTFPGVAPIAR